ncbi:ABC transporter permease [Spirosoma sp. BT702]|uniref:ABC transporter permease n=1 Tax=Spirosoma profusum TaxID=2771354 RepID=A0A926XX08_9BACT|nr:ABC transporter permease [Spirosoma profusum]MBD2699243.1 ABC transporter permease [Spirosoma profusum]
MLTNYFILAYRNLLRNKVASFINIVGLSIAIASAITVFIILKNFWTLDDFHVNGDRIYMLEYTTQAKDEVRTFGDAPAPMAAALAQYPQVKRMVRVEQEGVSIYHKESVFSELLTYADTSFFSLFTFPLKYGNPAALSDPAALILSHKTAEKYFPNQNPIGQPFMVVTEGKEKKQFVVRGVAEKFPSNAGMKFELLTGYDQSHSILKKQDWTTHIRGLFVEINHPEEAQKLARQMSQYVAVYNAKNIESPIQSFLFDNLRHPAPNAYDVRRRPAEANHPITTLLFSAMALIMMGLSCFNYVNISLGTVTQRLKEIGMRKVMGGTRGQLIAQFMIENVLLCFVSLLLGLLITQVFLVPLFNSIMVMTISVSFAQNAPLWLFMAGILTFTAITSGAYPALYLSALRPIMIFASRQVGSHKSTFSGILLTAQFSLAFIAVILGVVISTTGIAWKKLDWGYNPDPLLVVRLSDSTQYGILKNELTQNPAISAISGAEEHVGESMILQEIHEGSESINVARYNVDATYFQTLGLPPTSGRLFSRDRLAENAQSTVVNEKFVQRLGWKGTVEGRSLRIDKQLYTVIGVVKDFKLIGSGAARPAMFTTATESQFQYLVARFEPNSGPSLVTTLERTWKVKFPRTTLSYFYQKEVFNSFDTTFQRLGQSFGYIAGLALLIACMGLYGLAAQHFARRLKEVSVRKVLGASVSQIIVLVNRRFILLLSIAGLIANMLCYVGIRLTLQQTEEFTGTYQPGLSPFLIANLIVFVTAAIAVGRQTWKTAYVQLAETLRNAD